MNDTGEALSEPGACIKPQLRDGLVNRKTRLESQLKDINAAIDALDANNAAIDAPDANPDVAKLLELVGKASRY